MRLGAKYKCKANRSRTFECVFATADNEENRGRTAVLRWIDDNHLVWDYAVFRDDWECYEEYVEPRREFFNVHKDNSDTTYYRGAFSSRDIADRVSYGGRYGVLELIHHSETRVESVFHMVRMK